MKSLIPLDELQKKMSAISSVVPGKTTMPILSMVLIKAEENLLTFSATDLDISVTSRIKGKVEKNGSIAAPAKKLTEIVKSLSGDQVSFEVDKGALNIVSGRSSFVINGRNADDFPQIPKQEGKTGFSIDFKLLEKLIKKTTYAVSTDLTRPALCGVLCKVNTDGMTMVSTDGHRLAKIDLKQKFTNVDKIDVIIPPKALSTLKQFSSGQNRVNIQLAENNVSFSMEDVVIYSRLLEGPFPDFSKVIPENNKKELVLSRTSLLEATKRVSILSDSLTHLVVFSIKEGKILINVKTKELGGAKEEIDVSYSDNPMEIGYNANYLQDILRTMEGDNIIFYLDRPDNAGVVVPAKQEEEYDHLCIIMPLRIN
ncbi:MAG: DNA polymerase III subunit beta [Candidatus Krumholzibacteriota bacterium]|nr:DNA polymerase III subunit beta [Candidatus Krumholzibacteriota bacterium]